MAEIIDLFKTALYSTELNLDNNKMIRYCKRLQKEDKGRVISNEGGWQSNNLEGEHPILNELFEDIEHHGTLFAKDTLKVRHPLYLDNIWININGYRDYNNSHIHSNSLISGVYYVKTHKNCGVIRFNHPCFNLYDTIWNNVNKKAYNNYNSPTWWLPSTEGVLYLFPSWLEHLVTPNFHKTKKRISISFNVI